MSLPGSIHTFGFGYSIESGLLKSIAEVGGGNYAFIPDASMLVSFSISKVSQTLIAQGTVIIHAVANLQSTFATSATLTISTCEGLEIAQTVGNYVQSENKNPDHPRTNLIVPLGNLQYGQSRDIELMYNNLWSIGRFHPTINVELRCTALDKSIGILSTLRSIQNMEYLSSELTAYHYFRSRICTFLSSIAPLSRNQERETILNITTKQEELNNLISDLEATKPNDGLNQSLLHDLSGEISLALSTHEIYTKWGRHYLLSMHNAHFKQLCISFKDPGPLQYGKDSPLFIACRDRMEKAFASLPPPIPSIPLIDERGKLKKGAVSMSSYHDREGGCFAAGCGVKLRNGTTVKVETLRAGVTVQTPRGARKVAAIVETTVMNKEMCRLGNLVITPWHPIHFHGSWTFPNAVTCSTFLYSGTIYSLMLEPDKDVGAHGVEVGGHLAVTLGHGITRANIAQDNRSHAFFGDYVEVQRSLTRLKIRDGVFISMGIKKVGVNGLACGFLGENSDKHASMNHPL
jgi:Hint-domain/VWA / Hh  protein intein-like